MRKGEHTAPEARMRVVIAAMIDLRLPDRRRLVLLSRTRWTSRRERFYSPFGGALRAKPDGRHALKARFDLVWEGPGEDADDLRVNLPARDAEAFVEAVLNMSDDRRDMLTALGASLSKNSWRNTVSSMGRSAWRGALKRIGTYRTESVSSNPELAHPSRTHYVFETYAACLRGHAAAKLEHARPKATRQTSLRWQRVMASRKMLGGR